MCRMENFRKIYIGISTETNYFSFKKLRVYKELSGDRRQCRERTHTWLLSIGSPWKSTQSALHHQPASSDVQRPVFVPLCNPPPTLNGSVNRMLGNRTKQIIEGITTFTLLFGITCLGETSSNVAKPQNLLKGDLH